MLHHVQGFPAEGPYSRVGTLGRIVSSGLFAVLREPQDGTLAVM